WWGGPCLWQSDGGCSVRPGHTRSAARRRHKSPARLSSRRVLPDCQAERSSIIPEPDLLVTKFTVPRLRSMLLQRSHLLTVLDQGRSFPLTLLSAPAGFGKTTLLSAWARQSTSQVAWVTLDDQDNDPTRFWAYVIAALR